MHSPDSYKPLVDITIRQLHALDLDCSCKCIHCNRFMLACRLDEMILPDAHKSLVDTIVKQLQHSIDLDCTGNRFQ